MSSLQFCFTAFVMLTLFSNTFFPLVLAEDIHLVEKRQIGVLARTGALPQGKRSVEVLARNGELPHGRKDLSEEEAEEELIEELERAENLSRLRAQALAEKIFRAGKRSVAALARNGELPQKRPSEAVARSGYLIKPSPEVVQSPPDLFDPDDFLADGQSSMAPDFPDERSLRTFLSAPKRSLGSAKDFLLDSRMIPLSKKSLASLARDGGFDSLRHPLLKDRKADGGSGWAEDDKRNAPASRSLGKREILGLCCDQNQMSRLVEKAYDRLRAADPEYEDAPEANADGNSLKKRFLGRIPQLGRIHQKVQSPSSRRRPHLRPNWL